MLSFNEEMYLFLLLLYRSAYYIIGSSTIPSFFRPVQDSFFLPAPDVEDMDSMARIKMYVNMAVGTNSFVSFTTPPENKSTKAQYSPAAHPRKVVP